MYFIVLVLTSAAIRVLLDSFSIEVLSRLRFVPSSPFVAALAFQHSTPFESSIISALCVRFDVDSAAHELRKGVIDGISVGRWLSFVAMRFRYEVL